MAQTTLPVEVEFEDFLREYAENRAEWVAGRVVPMSPVRSRHQALTVFFTRLLGDVVEERGGRVFSENFLMRLDAVPSGRCPDVMVLLPEHLSRVQETQLDGPADLVIEIVSIDSVSRDRGEKFVEYEQAGIPEFWLIDPDRQVAEFWILDGGRYRLAPILDGRFASHILPDVWIEPEWLWRDPLPKVRQIVRAWGLP